MRSGGSKLGGLTLTVYGVQASVGSPVVCHSRRGSCVVWSIRDFE